MDLDQQIQTLTVLISLFQNLVFQHLFIIVEIKQHLGHAKIHEKVPCNPGQNKQSIIK